jgi:hypothetical protein
MTNFFLKSITKRISPRGYCKARIVIKTQKLSLLKASGLKKELLISSTSDKC